MSTDENRSFGIMLKPVGSACNLCCEYCYYREQGPPSNGSMSATVLEEAVRQILDIHDKKAVVKFSWHGGEPLLAGLGFYQEVVTLQKRFGQGRCIHNSIQTNGTLLDEAWCRFLAQNDFEVGLSLDGPQPLHDAYRRTASGEGSWQAAMRGAELLRQHGIPCTTITAVHAANAGEPEAVYSFLRTVSSYIQIIPILERTKKATCSDRLYAMPPAISNDRQTNGTILPFSVSVDDFGRFMCGLLDAWRQDEEPVPLGIQEMLQANLRGCPAGSCVHEAVCGHRLCIEKDGSVYPCDRYVYPEYRLGDLTTGHLAELAAQSETFGMIKAEDLADQCFGCSYLTLCFGGCLKDRVAQDGGGSLNCFCEAYRSFFRHVLEGGG